MGYARVTSPRFSVVWGTPLEHEQTSPEQRKEGESAPESTTSDTSDISATPAARRRRVRRTTLLIAGAAVLGALAGTATGYAVQYHREPTPLPPLAQQKMDGPKPAAMNDATSHRSINAHRWHKADEDLAKKLLEVPGGAQDSFSGPVSTDTFSADYFLEPSQAVGSLIRQGKRLATARWAENDRNFVEVNLLQFRDRAGADDFYTDIVQYMPEKDHAGNTGKDLPGAPSDFGHMWIDSKAHQEPGYHPIRQSRAVVRRGDIVMSVKYTNNRGEIDEKALVELAKRQMERL
ncbi:hypothetical protein B1K54_17155 [Streptomyces sp. fd1-xmd]|uniref:Tat pathway signal sequence domain protein n=1 Tax=Streptomyces amritsarensis TaxID=681158 RepID=A0ABX3FXB9_9ACTN|nr:hypothetical protein B1K54_17155 [Streptomyces sp. fd1-xmd]OLZ48930.1 hypothetical protein AVW11_32955 [Streptomyces amritsarensis]